MKFIVYYIIISNGNKDNRKKLLHLIKNINEILILRYLSYKTKKKNKNEEGKNEEKKKYFFYIFYLLNLIIRFLFKKIKYNIFFY